MDHPVQYQWGIKIPMRDGVRLHATLYRPPGQRDPLPCIFTLTPYVADSYHERGMYFASHGYVFLTVDVRGRGNSEGKFRPLFDARDGHDAVEWLAGQSYCNGKVAMWGGSYAGFDQWQTASQRPPHLSTIVPVAAPYAGADFPMAGNIWPMYELQWLTLVSGRAFQGSVFGDDAFWAERFRRHHAEHRPYAELDTFVGNPSSVFKEWISHPQMDAYWDTYNPTAAQYAAMDLPILTITGQYDGDQPGAMAHYRQHFANASPQARAKHFLIIGPWDHAQTRTPTAEVGGLPLGAASVLDMNDLHRQWYDWTLKSGARPEFLQKPVVFYVTGAERWRYADSLEAVTTASRPMYLASQGGYANDVFRSGSLQEAAPDSAPPDHYVYDPLDVSAHALEATLDPANLKEQRHVLQSNGKSLIYHSAPFAADTEISGFFRLHAWLAIDQPDTDFSATAYEIAPDGSSLFLSNSILRARYRESVREAKLVTHHEPLEYRFDRFTFVARRIAKGSRLRLVIGPLDSIHVERNYNSGKVVMHETAANARTVTVKLFHDAQHPSALYVPLGTTQD
jgi:putative CocE/NonD family hydrolase